MKSKFFLFRIYLLITVAIALIAAGLRSAACLTALNFDTGYFSDKLLIGISDKLVIGAVIFALSYVFLAGKEQKLIFDFSSPLNYVFGGTLGVALLFFAFHAFNIFDALFSEYQEYRYSASSQKLVMYISLIMAILALASVAHFIIGGLVTKNKNTGRADFGLITVLFLSVYATYLYFNNAQPINSPAKIVDQMAYLSSAIFFLYETRISIGREKWRVYSAFGFCAALLTAYSSIPSIITYLATGQVISDSIYESSLTFTLCLFVSARLILTAKLREEKESEIVTLIKSNAAMRELFLNPEPAELTEEDTEAVNDNEPINSEEYYELHFEQAENINGSTIIEESEL